MLFSCPFCNFEKTVLRKERSTIHRLLSNGLFLLFLLSLVRCSQKEMFLGRERGRTGTCLAYSGVGQCRHRGVPTGGRSEGSVIG